MWKVFNKGVYFKRYKLQNLPLEEYKDDQQQFKRSFRSKWFAKTMQYFAKHYTKQQTLRDSLYKSKKLHDSIKLITTGKKETKKSK